jgi:rare lipoprotein A
MTRGVPAQAVRLALILLAAGALAACATVQSPRYAARPTASNAPPRSSGQASPRGYKTGEPYQVAGIWYVPKDEPDYDKTGIASWYGDAFHMKATADGEIFDMNAFSAAHTTLPLPSLVEVTNLDNGRKLTVRVNDRGPFVDNRIIDLSHAAAAELGYDRKGLARVRVRYLGPAPLAGPADAVRVASAKSSTPARPAALPDSPISTAPLELAVLGPPPVVTEAALPPLAAPKPAPDAPPAEAGAARPVMLAATAPYRIQAGAFSDPVNARRAVAQLAVAGQAVIEPIERPGGTLYRVVLPAPTDELQAFALRDRIAGIGFTDARVVKAPTVF